jgi:hypothetical protein
MRQVLCECAQRIFMSDPRSATGREVTVGRANALRLETFGKHQAGVEMEP